MQLQTVSGALEKQVASAITQGNSIPDVVEFILSENSNTSKEEILSLAFEWFSSASNTPEEFHRGWCFEAYRELYRKMIEIGDYAGAVKCVKEISVLSKSNKDQGTTKNIKLRINGKS